MAVAPDKTSSIAETQNFSSGLPEKKGIASRLYEGLYKIPGINRIVGKMEIAYNQFRADKNEKKSAKFKSEMDVDDLSVNALDRSKAQIEATIETLKRQGMPGTESLQIKLKEIDRQKMEILSKKDKKQSKFEAKDNKVKLYVNHRDAITNRLIGRYDEKLYPMEKELEGLQACKRRADLEVAMMNAEHEASLIEMQEIEQQKAQLEEAYRSIGYSDKKIKKDVAIKILAEQLAQNRKRIGMENEVMAKRQDVIDRKIAKVDAKANPYRDKREEFARVKAGRPVDMKVKTRERSQVFAGEETIIGHTRQERRDEPMIGDETVDGSVEAQNESQQQAEPQQPTTSSLNMPPITPSQKNIETTEEETVSTNDPLRAAAWHTIRKMEDLKMKYSDLNGATEKEREEKFLELTRRLWNEFTVHGITKNGSMDLIRESDLDGESWLKLLELAGFSIDRDKVNFIKSGTTRESGVIGDTSEKQSGVIAEDKGKKLTMDHHGPESDRTTSATKFAYELLTTLNLLKKEDYLDKFVDFVTACDNLEFSADTYGTVYKNYAKNLYGLRQKIKLEDILQMFKDGIDPAQEIPEDRLKSMEYEDSASKSSDPAKMKKKSLFEFSEEFRNNIDGTDETIKKMEDFVLDTGGSRFGKVLIDTGRIVGKGKWIAKVYDNNHSAQLAAFASGYGAYLKWSQKNNGFVIFTKDKKIDEDTVPGGFGQGFNVRGHMWMKPEFDDDTQKVVPLTVKLEDILAKLAGQSPADFKMDDKLKKAFDKATKNKSKPAFKRKSKPKPQPAP